MAGNDVPLNVLLDRTVQQLEHAEALADKRLVLLRHTKKTMDSALRSLKAIGNSSYMPIMNRLERMIEMTEKELADE